MQRNYGYVFILGLRALGGSLLVTCFCALFMSPVFAQKGDAEVLLAEATMAYDAKEYQKTLELLTQAHERDPQNARVLYYLGLTHLALNQPEIAQQKLEAARQLKPDDLYIRYQLGMAYFAQHQYDEAEPLLFDAYEEQPGLESLGYCVGFLHYREKDYDEALAAFNTETSKDPNIQQLTMFYSGLASGVLGLPEQAIIELDEAAKADAVSPLTQGAIQLRDTLAAGRRTTQERKRLTAQLSIGGYYDDNVAINPNRNSDATVQALRDRKAPSPGVLASALFNYAWLRHGPFESTINYSFFQTLNVNNYLSRFDTQDHLIGIGGFYRGNVFDLPYQLAVEYSFDYLWLDSVPFLSRHSPTFSATLVEPVITLPIVGQVGNITTAIVRHQVKEFFNEPSNNDPRFVGIDVDSDVRDGFNTMLGFTHVFRFSEDAHLLRIGYQYDNENTDGSNFTYQGHRFLTGGQVSLPVDGLRLRYSFDMHWRDYNAGANTIFPQTATSTVQRDDTQHNHLVQLVQDLPNNFALTGQYQRIRNDSNIAVFDYTKNVFTVILSWTY
ncbi:tetratricopeptide repeat protein [Nitrospira sp. M1]